MRPIGGIVDSHLHLWDPARLTYPWLNDIPRLHRRFGLQQLAEAAPAPLLAGMIFVECNCAPGQAPDEVKAVRELAREDSRLLGAVAFADLTRPEELPGVLSEYAASGFVVGIRHNIQGHPAGFCLSAPFVEGVREAGRRGFTFDLCATHDQLGEVVRLAESCPGTPLVLDHCGKPPIAEGHLDPWRTHVRELAAMPHVWCKLSGLLTEAGPAWTDETLLPYVEHVVEHFGAGRLMYGGDWPVLTLAGTYLEWYQFTRRFTAGWNHQERSGFYGENALRFYGIGNGERNARG